MYELRIIVTHTGLRRWILEKRSLVCRARQLRPMADSNVVLKLDEIGNEMATFTDV